MIIKRIALHNFGVYAGDNIFEFTNTRPVVLVGGMNGRGKTTFLESVLLALYGANSFAYQESDYTSYGKYLKSLINVADGTFESFVELVIHMDGQDEDLTIKRSWDALGKRTKERIEIKCGENVDQFLTDNWALFIEGMIPSALSPYFFFDGDNIAELAVAKSDQKMKASIKALLGISVLDTLETDLKRLAGKTRKKKDAEVDVSVIEKLREQKDADLADLQIIEEKIAEAIAEQETIRKDIEKKKEEYVAKGGDVAEQRNQMIHNRNLQLAMLKQKEQQLVELAATALPLQMITNLLSNIRKQVSAEKNDNDIRLIANNLEELVKEFGAENEDVQLSKFITFVSDKAKSSKKQMIFSGSETLILQLDTLCDFTLESEKNKLNEIKKDIVGLRSEIDQIDKYLEVDIDEDTIRRIYKGIKHLEEKSIDVEERLARLEKQRGECNGRSIRSTSEYNKYVESMLAKLELTDDVSRIIKYSGLADMILKNYRTKLQARKVTKLADTITACYVRLSNKKNLITNVEMDPSTLDFSYKNSKGDVVEKSSLSEGEKQMMIIAILWALAISSNRKLPVIIDTPLARLDSSHRKSLIETYFPNASEQTIILSTDSEIYGDYYKLLKKHVGDEYILIYNDETKSTTVHQGYFGEMK